MFINIFIKFQELSSKLTKDFKESLGIKEASVKEVVFDLLLLIVLSVAVTFSMRFVSQVFGFIPFVKITTQVIALAVSAICLGTTITIIRVAWSKALKKVTSFFVRKERETKDARSAFLKK